MNGHALIPASSTAIAVASGQRALPALFTADVVTARRTLEFFTAHIRNPHTRRAYAVNRRGILTRDRRPKLTPFAGRPGSPRKGPARDAACPCERRGGTRGKALWTHLGDPAGGWGPGRGDGFGLGAVFEAPALVAGFDDLAVMGEPIEERGRHLGVAEH